MVEDKFKTFCLPQRYGILPIHSRENILVSSPTGSGKTTTLAKLVHHFKKLIILLFVQTQNVHHTVKTGPFAVYELSGFHCSRGKNIPGLCIMSDLQSLKIRFK